METITVSQTEIESMPLEQLEREITDLAAHINAATCRWLLLVGELDRREAWADWGHKSCAQWLSVRCGICLRTAHEQVRVARSLSGLPRIRELFGRGELSYSQVRALTRVATPDLEEDLLTVARHGTGAQLETLCRAYRGVLSRALEAANDSYRDRYLFYTHEDDGSLVLSARIPGEEGALVLTALDAARDQLHDRSRRDEAARERPLESKECSAEHSSSPAANGADALVLMAETVLASGCIRVGAERHQVIVHVDAATLADDKEGACHVERGPALHPETARRLACDAGVLRIVERDGRPLSVGRKTRSVPPALARALRSRDGGCRFPGCTEHRFVDAHHIEHWARGGKTNLSNLVQLCRRHHRLLHEGGYKLEKRARSIVFRRPDGRLIPAAPQLRRGDRRELEARNRRAGLSLGPETCVPRWDGDRLDAVLAVDCLVSSDVRLAEPRGP